MIIFRLIAIGLFFVTAMPVPGFSLSVQKKPVPQQTPSFSLFPELQNKIDPKVFTMALAGYHSLKQQGKVARDGLLTIIDFNRPSVDERMFVIDINRGRLLYSGLVAHGSGSGENYAYSFSNQSGSHQSSLGFYTTGQTYDGRNGYSLRLLGMERGINDNAERRSNVIHGADYVSHDYIRRTGRLGRSQGCPAVSLDSYQEVIDLIKGGSCLFIYHNDVEYTSASSLLNPDIARFQAGYGGQS